MRKEEWKPSGRQVISWLSLMFFMMLYIALGLDFAPWAAAAFVVIAMPDGS